MAFTAVSRKGSQAMSLHANQMQFSLPQLSCEDSSKHRKKKKERGGAIKVGIRQVRATRAEDHYTDRLRMQS